jgi:hypothetical protein
MLKATVSGSFRRHMSAVYEAVTELTEFGITVLSPSDPRVVDQIGEFVFVASDKVRSIKMVEDRHLECIHASDFLWLVTPDGYVGQSASMELGYAVAQRVPIFSQDLPTDGTLRKYVELVPSISAILPRAYSVRRGTATRSTLLVDPVSVIEEAHNRLDSLRTHLMRPAGQTLDPEGEAVLAERDHLQRILGPVRGTVRHEAAL